MSENLSDRIEQWISWGKELETKGLHNEAINCFRVATEIDATLPEELILKGQAFTHLGDYSKADLLYSSAISLDLSYAVAYNSKGMNYEDEGYMKADPTDGTQPNLMGAKLCFEEALIYYNMAIGFNPNYADAINNKGVALIYLSRYQEAIDCFNKVIKLDPNCPDVYYNLSIAQSKMGRGSDADISMQTAMDLGLMNMAEYMEEGLSRESAK